MSPCIRVISIHVLTQIVTETRTNENDIYARKGHTDFKEQQKREVSGVRGMESVNIFS